MNEEVSQLSKNQTQQVCRNLSKLAVELNVTQEAIAQNVGIERTSVNRVFSGRNSPRLDVIFSVLAALNELSGRRFTLKDIDLAGPDPDVVQPVK